MTYRPRGAAGLLVPAGLPTIGGDSDSGGVTVMLHHSMIELPEQPMKPRRYDDRVGFFNGLVRRLRQPEAGGGARLVHHPMAAREEGPQGRGLRAQEADRLLHRPRGAGEVAPLDQEGGRGLAAGLREGGLQERHPRQGAAQPARRPGLGRRGRALLRRSDGSPPPSRTPTARTSTTRGPARSSSPTSACITTS